MNLTQLRSPFVFLAALAAANMTLLAEDAPKLDRPPRDGQGERGEREGQPDRARTIQELERMKREIGELREAGKVDEAREKERNLGEAMRKLKEGGRGDQQPDRNRVMHERLARMKQEIGELREAGKTEQAQEMERNLQAAMRQLSQDRPMQPGTRWPERMQHLEQAIQHVEAAGLAEVSRDLRKVAEQMREEMKRQEREASVRRESPEGERGEINDLRRELERNRDEMQRMQREIRELRAKAGAQSPAPDRRD